MAISNYLAGEVLKHAFRTGSWTKPTTLYAALFTSDPMADASGTEVSGGSYARVSISVADAQWSAVSGRRTGNVNAITFPTPTGSWGTVGWGALFDASTGGNMYFFGPLDTAFPVGNGDAAPSFAADQFGTTIN